MLGLGRSDRTFVGIKAVVAAEECLEAVLVLEAGMIGRNSGEGTHQEEGPWGMMTGHFHDLEPESSEGSPTALLADLEPRPESEVTTVFDAD
jgi:hypothetical protein